MKKLIVFALFAMSLCVVYAQQPAHKCQHANCQHQASCQKASALQSSANQKPAQCQQSKATGYESLAVDDFAARIAGKKIILLDVRTAKEYAEGHLSGAKNVEWNANFESVIKKMGLKKGTIAVYCRSGRRSKAAAEVLVRMGYTVIELDKGIVGWQQAGKAVEK